MCTISENKCNPLALTVNNAQKHQETLCNIWCIVLALLMCKGEAKFWVTLLYYDWDGMKSTYTMSSVLKANNTVCAPNRPHFKWSIHSTKRGRLGCVVLNILYIIKWERDGKGMKQGTPLKTNLDINNYHFQAQKNAISIILQIPWFFWFPGSFWFRLSPGFFFRRLHPHDVSWFNGRTLILHADRSTASKGDQILTFLRIDPDIFMIFPHLPGEGC